jgi:hypothetical protein
MDASRRYEVPRDTAHVPDRSGNPRVDVGLQEPCSNDQTAPRNLGGYNAPDEGSSETFVGGAGI